MAPRQDTPLQPPKYPLIIILGPTGTGKSNLALSLASHIPSEIINADAMQMYSGLPIITNKLPLSERQNIPHHLLDFIPLDAKPWTVSEFVDESTKVIREIRSRGRLPIVVGGTNYYTHGLLFRNATLNAHMQDGGLEQSAGQDAVDRFPVLNSSTEAMYAKLTELDPDMANSWHPNDRRHIQRSLEICLTTGRKASKIYREQAESRENGVAPVSQDPSLRYDPLLLWLNAEETALKTRLDNRVDEMVKGGLFDEALSLVQREQEYKAQGVEIDKSKGIWVSIGYKEMIPWATEQMSTSNGLDTASFSSKLASQCIESVKVATRQYAKSQNSYIRIRLANALKDEDVFDRLFVLDSSDLNQWESAVVQTARDLVDNFLDGRPLPEPTALSELAEGVFSHMAATSEKPTRINRSCDVCEKVLPTEREWHIHATSNGHKKALARRRKYLDSLPYLREKQRLVGANASAEAE